MSARARCLTPRSSRRHSRLGEDPRHHVEGDQPLGVAALAVDREGDADAAEQRLGLLLLLGQHLGRGGLHPVEQPGIGRPDLLAVEHLVEGADARLPAARAAPTKFDAWQNASVGKPGALGPRLRLCRCRLGRQAGMTEFVVQTRRDGRPALRCHMRRHRRAGLCRFASLPAMCLSSRQAGARAPDTNRELRMAAERGNAAFVAFEHVQKSYDGETLVVKDLNLDIGQGEFLTMLGPSGSGKTTCLMMLAGFETATHGEIRLAGRPINNIPPHKRGIGMVFQNYALFPHMTVGENLAFPLQVRKLPKAEIDAKVARALDMVQMGRFAGRRPAQLSGGQQQRDRARPRAGLRARARADGRAARRARQAAPRAHAVRDQAPARAARRHRGLRHPRPVRGADHVRPDRGLQRRHDPAARAARGPLRAARRTPSSRSSSARTTAWTARSTAIEGGFATVGSTTAIRCRALAVSCGEPGARTQLSIRPERVIVGDRRAEENRVEARVLELIYHGDHIRCRMEVHGNRDFIVKVPNAAGVEHAAASARRRRSAGRPRTAARSTAERASAGRRGPSPLHRRSHGQTWETEHETDNHPRRRGHRRRLATRRGAGPARLRGLRRRDDRRVLGRRLPGLAAEGLSPSPTAELTGIDLHLGRELERGGRQAPRPVRGRQRHLGPRRRRGPRQPAPLRRGPGDGDRLRRGARARRRRLRRPTRTSATA